MEKSTRPSNICKESTENLQKKIHLLFAIDLLYFIAQSNGVKWEPTSQVIDKIYELSPLSNDIKEAVLISLQNSDIIYQELFDNLTFCKPRSKYHRFTAYITACYFNLRRPISNYTPYRAFNLVVHIAALSMVFYREGLPYALDQAVIAIAKVLSDAARMFDIDLYILFSVNALGIKLRNYGRQTEILHQQ